MGWVIVAIAGFLGGMLNALAGGGSFITLPALIYVGLPPVSANATGTAALLPGYIASAWRFRGDIKFPEKLGFIRISLIAVLGGSLGAVILLITSERLFSLLIPWLILFATAAFAVGPWLLQKQQVRAEKSARQRLGPAMRVSIAGMTVFIVCVYGGYFNGGLGIILLAALGLMGPSSLHGLNGLKNLLSAILTSVAVVVYVIGDSVAGEYLLLLGVMAVLGGYFGAALAYRISPLVLRGFIVLVGCLMASGFFFSEI
jgi:hypothetical protein